MMTQCTKAIIVCFGLAVVALAETSGHFSYETTGDNFVPVLIDTAHVPTIDGVRIVPGDEIGVFTPGGICAGAIAWVGRDTAFNLYTDNSQTASVVEGFVDGDSIVCRIFNASSGETFPAVITLSGPSAAGKFRSTDLYYTVVSMAVHTPARITADPDPLSVWHNESASFTVHSTGDSPRTFRWQKNGVDIFGETDSVLSIDSTIYADSGLYRCIVSNVSGCDTSEVAQLTIKNHAPVMTGTTELSVSEDGSITISLSMINASDVDGDSLVILLGSGAHYAVLGTTITPDADWHGPLVVAVRVSDGIDTSAVADLSIEVASVNDAPVLAAPLGDLVAALGSAFHADLPAGQFTDVDGDSLHITVEGLPSDFTFIGTAIDGLSATEGMYAITITATDDSGAVATELLTLIVTGASEIRKTEEGGRPPPAFAAFPNPAGPDDREMRFFIPAVTGEAEFAIYDPMGVLLDRQTAVLNGGEVFAWDLCNAEGVRVHGAAVAVLRVVDKKGETSVRRAMIGVRE